VCILHFFFSERQVSNLLKYSSFVVKPFENGCQVVSIYTDFSKAFDRVSHCLFLNKMSSDSGPACCQWLRSYFSGGIQRISTSDVPQGNHLGPLCFIWFFDWNRIKSFSTNECFFMLITWSCFSQYVVFRIARRFRAIWTGWPTGMERIYWNWMLVSVSQSNFQNHVILWNSLTCWEVLSLAVLSLTLIWWLWCTAGCHFLGILMLRLERLWQCWVCEKIIRWVQGSLILIHTHTMKK
jgi:hypothetical protein